MQEGGDRGKAPNKTGTRPKKQNTRSPKKNARGKTAGGASAAMKKGPRKTTARKATRSADK